MLRPIVKTCVACAYSWGGVRHWSPRAYARHLPFIIAYHRVVDNFVEAARHTIPAMLISAATFEKQIDWLARRFRIVSLDEAGPHLENGTNFKRPAAAITFDDGYADVFHNAFPILKRKGLPAAVFVATAFVGTNRMTIADRLYRCLKRQRSIDPFSKMTSMLVRLPQVDVLKRLEALEARLPDRGACAHEMIPMTWEMLEEMQKSGITIGSHTDSHVLLTSEAAGNTWRQLTESKRVLEERLQRPVIHFAYPDGRCNPQTVRAVKAAGYRFGYTCCSWRDSNLPLMTIPRKVLWEKATDNIFGRFSSSVMDCHVGGVFERSGGCGHNHEGTVQ